MKKSVLKFLAEFKEFALRGNVMSLAVGVIIGSAFQNIVTSLTENILSPLIGLFSGQNFDSLELRIFGITLQYGAFLTAVINFVIVAFVVFLLVRTMNKLLSPREKNKEEAAPATKPCPYCLTEVKLEATRCPACTSSI